MPLWTPSLISSSLWIDFSDSSTLFDATTGGSPVTNGVGIARAEDKSGNGRHFTQGTAGQRPTWNSGVKNSLGIARFDGGDWLDSSNSAAVWNFLHSGDSSIFVVNKNGTSANPLAAYGWLGNNGGSSTNRGTSFWYDDRGLLTGMEDAFNGLSCDAGGILSYSGTTVGPPQTIATEFRNLITPNVFGLFSINSDPSNATASNRLKISVNGGNLTGNNSRTGGLSSNDATFTLQLGAVGNNAIPFIGDFCEIVIFDSILSTASRQLVEGYLAWKWGLEANLPVSHPYKNAAPQAPTGIGGEVGWWCPSLDDAGNGTGVLNDLTGNSNEGTLTNMDPATDWFADTASGGVRALDFDGVNDYVAISSSPADIATASSGFTYSCWIYVRNWDGPTFVFAILSTGTQDYRSASFQVYLRKLTFVADNNGAADWAIGVSTPIGNTTLNLSQWYHVGLVRQSGVYTVYINGSSDGSVTYNNNLLLNNTSIKIGGHYSANTDNMANGLIDDVRIFSRAITSQEMAILASKRGYQPVSNTRRRRYAGSYGL